ncbi:MAG: four helix bundle protein [bacterium]
MPSNIAEGFERNSIKEFIRFLYKALSSCARLKTQLHQQRDRYL